MPEMIYFLTGAIHSGKTTALVQWAQTKRNAGGILTPRLDEQRVFQNLGTKEVFPMEASGNEEAMVVGKYRFSKTAFEKAAEAIRNASHNNDWVVIDEIGPLELKDSGFSEVLREVLASKNDSLKLVLVIRDSILQEAISHFSLEQFPHQMITARSLLLMA